jgi:putative ABC transport system substrate-binding protein
MKRRNVIALLGGAKVAFSLAARAQQPERLRRVGVLIAFPQTDPLAQAIVGAFARAMAGFGWVEAKNIWIDYRFAAGDPSLFKSFAAELVGLTPDVILASTPPAIAAVRQQTTKIPIVFVFVIDPIGLGLVESFARPGGNITGFGSFDPPVMGKWLQLLKEIAPGSTRVGVIFNPSTTIAPAFNSAIEAAAPSFGMTVKSLPVHDDAAIEEAIATHAREPGGVLITLPDSFNITHRDTIIAAAARHRLPLMGLGEIFPKSGGLISYFFDPVDVFAQAATYIDRILKGASPAELPVQQPTKFSLVINLKTAKALGLTVPQSLLQRADEVIE